jgi:hypothetical protein
MFYVVYFGGKSTGDNWTLLETHIPLNFPQTIAEFKWANPHMKHPSIRDLVEYINRRYGEGMARRAPYKTVVF